MLNIFRILAFLFCVLVFFTASYKVGQKSCGLGYCEEPTNEPKN